jgi:hypothetical protein
MCIPLSVIGRLPALFKVSCATGCHMRQTLVCPFVGGPFAPQSDPERAELWRAGLAADENPACADLAPEG